MGDWVTLAGVVVAAVGVGFAGWQLRHIRRQADHDRRVALEGVTVSWRAAIAPDHAESDGQAEWVYEFVAHNPGRLPIDNIVVSWVFDCSVRRVRYSGRIGDPVQVLTFRTPVLAAGDRRTWTRRLRISFESRRSLRGTYAEISFVDIDGKHHTNRWPRTFGGQIAEHDAEDVLR